jgi:hypothetical protein
VNQYGIDFSAMMQKVQQDLAEVGIQIELQPVEFSVWREHVNGEGIPITAVFYAPDYYGSGQYVQYFGMTEGSAWANRAGAKNDPSVLNPREAELLKQALAAGPEESATVFAEIAGENDQGPRHHPAGQPEPRAGASEGCVRRALQRLLQPADRGTVAEVKRETGCRPGWAKVVVIAGLDPAIHSVVS